MKNKYRIYYKICVLINVVCFILPQILLVYGLIMWNEKVILVCLGLFVSDLILCMVSFYVLMPRLNNKIWLSEKSVSDDESISAGLEVNFGKTEIWVPSEAQETPPFKVNKYITLKLENNRTNIYVDGKEFNQCKFLLLNLPEHLIEKSEIIESIDGIDDLAEELNHELEGIQYNIQKEITPEIEFFGHCSNIQAWVEHGYNTRILHSNLSFPLLKRLTEVGDPKAKAIFKEEIADRFIIGNQTLREILNEGNYLGYLDIEEIMMIIKTVLEKEGKIEVDIELRDIEKEGKV